jgi:hypothetical protein
MKSMTRENYISCARKSYTWVFGENTLKEIGESNDLKHGAEPKTYLRVESYCW